MIKRTDVRRHEETAFSIATSTSSGGAGRSDLVTGTSSPGVVPLSTLSPSDRPTSPELLPHHRAFSLDDEDKETAEQPPSQINQVVIPINSLPAILQRDITQIKVLHTQVSNFRGLKYKFNELEHLLLNHMPQHQHTKTKENKLYYFQNLLRDEAIDLWQTMRINSETNVREILIQFRQKFAREDFKKTSKFKWNYLTYDSSKETFAEFLKTRKKAAKQAFGDKASEFVETFPFRILQIQIRHELSTAGKTDASAKQINC